MAATRPFVHANVLDAYRADLARSGRPALGTDDHNCLVFATLLHHAILLPRADRRAYLANAFSPKNGMPEDLVPSESADVVHALGRTARRLAESAERLGGFAVATTILDLMRGLVDEKDTHLIGLLIHVQARILRKIGQLDVAVELLAEVDRLGESTDDVDLRALAAIGSGVVARVRGNYPSARKFFTAALCLAPRTDSELNVGLHAHQGLMIVCSVASDFDAAIRHGGAALPFARSRDQRAEVLSNLAAACSDAGEMPAALHGHLEAIASSDDSRIQIASIGGAAVAAAHLGRRPMARRLIGMADELASRTPGLEHEIADLYRELYVTASLIGDEMAARRYRRHAEQRATRHGFFEILHKLDAALPCAPTAQPLTTEALDVATFLATSDADLLLETATGSYHPG